jgi:hypothetical protein
MQHERLREPRNNLTEKDLELVFFITNSTTTLTSQFSGFIRLGYPIMYLL